MHLLPMRQKKSQNDQGSPESLEATHVTEKRQGWCDSKEDCSVLRSHPAQRGGPAFLQVEPCQPGGTLTLGHFPDSSFCPSRVREKERTALCKSEAYTDYKVFPEKRRLLIQRRCQPSTTPSQKPRAHERRDCISHTCIFRKVKNLSKS